MVSLSRSTKETCARQTKGKTGTQTELTRVHQSVSTSINAYQRISTVKSLTWIGEIFYKIRQEFVVRLWNSDQGCLANRVKFRGVGSGWGKRRWFWLPKHPICYTKGVGDGEISPRQDLSCPFSLTGFFIWRFK